MFGHKRCVLIGMVHVPALPGSPGWGGDMGSVITSVVRDAQALVRGGCDALIVENMHDLPYLRGAVPPETVASMAVATAAVTRLGLPTGVQVLAGANVEAIGVAVAAGAAFVRCEAFAYAHVADEGLMQASAGPVTRLRAALGADVAIWADVKKKHASHALTADLSIAEMARGHRFCAADALIITGTSTGQPTSLDDVRAAKEAGLPVAIGSGITEASAAAAAGVADALIVGTALKEGGDWRAPVSEARVAALAAVVRGG